MGPAATVRVSVHVFQVPTWRYPPLKQRQASLNLQKHERQRIRDRDLAVAGWSTTLHLNTIQDFRASRPDLIIQTSSCSRVNFSAVLSLSHIVGQHPGSYDVRVDHRGFRSGSAGGCQWPGSKPAERLGMTGPARLQRPRNARRGLPPGNKTTDRSHPTVTMTAWVD